MYISEGDLEKFVLQDIDATHSGWISDIIDHVGEYIDHYCGTNFAATAGSDTRYYDAGGLNELSIDPFTAITSIKILDVNGNVQQTLSASDYYLSPYNEDQFNRIILSSGGSLSTFPDRVRSVEVVGTFGYASVPGPIKLAACKLAAQIINEGLKGGQVESESLGSYSVNYKNLDDEADVLGIKEILNQYRVMSL